MAWRRNARNRTGTATAPRRRERYRAKDDYPRYQPNDENHGMVPKHDGARRIQFVDGIEVAVPVSRRLPGQRHHAIARRDRNGKGAGSDR